MIQNFKQTQKSRDNSKINPHVLLTLFQHLTALHQFSFFLDDGLIGLYVCFLYNGVFEYASQHVIGDHNTSRKLSVLRTIHANSFGSIVNFLLSVLSLALDASPGRESDTVFSMTMIKLCLIQLIPMSAFSLNVTCRLLQK